MNLKKLTIGSLLLGLFLSLSSHALASNPSTPAFCFAPNSPELPQIIDKREQGGGNNDDEGGDEDGTGIDSGGEISANENICDSGIPSGIKNITSPSGDIDGFLIIKWEKRTLMESWEIIPGATTLTYFPDYIDETTEYRRGCRESVSQPWKYSNTVTKFIVEGIEDVRVNPTDVTCKGGDNGSAEALVTGGTPGYTFEWPVSGSSENIISGLSAGTHSVTVTDANGCTFESDDFVIGEPNTSVLISEVFSFDPYCPGESSGAIFTEANFGVPPYSFDWSDGNSGPVNIDVPAGVYYVIVTDALGCKHAIYDITLTEPPEMQLHETTTAASCNGSSDGAGSFEVSGGTAPYSYFWQDGSESSSRSNLSAGVYIISVIDSYGCLYNEELVIEEPEPIEAGSITINNKICKASINLAPNGGTAPYTYEWEDGSTEGYKYELCPGQYIVKITDDNGCVQSETLEISANYLDENISIESVFNAGKSEAELNVKLPYDKPADIEIYAATGQLVSAFRNQYGDADKMIRLTVDMSKQSSGLYLINVRSAGIVATDKIVVSR